MVRGGPRNPLPEIAPAQLIDHLPEGSVFVARTAAILHGFDTLPPDRSSVTWPIEVCVPRNRPGPSEPGIRSYRWSLSSQDITEIDGVPVTTLERTAWDCARCLPRLEAVAAMDQYLRAGVDSGCLLIRAEADRRYGRRVASVVEAADPLAQSPGESRSRCLIVDAGLPRPRSQVPVGLADGRNAFLDLGYEEYRLGIEYYGAQFHDEDSRPHDAARLAALREQGWEMFVVRACDVTLRPDALLVGLLSRLRQRGWSPAPDHERKVRKRINYMCMMLRRQREMVW